MLRKKLTTLRISAIQTSSTAIHHDGRVGVALVAHRGAGGEAAGGVVFGEIGRGNRG